MIAVLTDRLDDIPPGQYCGQLSIAFIPEHRADVLEFFEVVAGTMVEYAAGTVLRAAAEEYMTGPRGAAMRRALVARRARGFVFQLHPRSR